MSQPFGMPVLIKRFGPISDLELTEVTVYLTVIFNYILFIRLQFFALDKFYNSFNI